MTLPKKQCSEYRKDTGQRCTLDASHTCMHFEPADGYFSGLLVGSAQGDARLNEAEHDLEAAEAKIRELDDETGRLRAAFMKAHTGHHCLNDDGVQQKDCWMLTIYRESLERAETDRKAGR